MGGHLIKMLMNGNHVCLFKRRGFYHIQGLKRYMMPQMDKKRGSLVGVGEVQKGDVMDGP
jgi:hypothetical protein